MASLKCANCGGLIELEKDVDFLTCPYCSSTLYLTNNLLFKNFYLQPIITEKYALSIFESELKRLNLQDMPVISVKKIFLPFFKKENESTLTPLFSPSPNYFSEIAFPSSEPLFFSETMKEWGELTFPSNENLIITKEKNGGIYYIPFYEFTFGIKEEKKRCFINAVSKAKFLDNLPLSFSQNQANKVTLLLIVYFLIFSALSFLIKPPLAAFFLTAVISIIVSPILANYLEKNE